MRVYIIGNDGITLCRKAPATVNDGEIAVAYNEELHTAPRAMILIQAVGLTTEEIPDFGRATAPTTPEHQVGVRNEFARRVIERVAGDTGGRQDR
jgi:hypothetical protein